MRFMAFRFPCCIALMVCMTTVALVLALVIALVVGGVRAWVIVRQSGSMSTPRCSSRMFAFRSSTSGTKHCLPTPAVMMSHGEYLLTFHVLHVLRMCV